MAVMRRKEEKEEVDSAFVAVEAVALVSRVFRMKI